MIYELVLRNFDCSLEFVFSLLLLQSFNFSLVSFVCNFQDWGCVISREIDFLLKILLIDSLLTPIVESTYWKILYITLTRSDSKPCDWDLTRNKMNQVHHWQPRLRNTVARCVMWKYRPFFQKWQIYGCIPKRIFNGTGFSIDIDEKNAILKLRLFLMLFFYNFMKLPQWLVWKSNQSF